MTRPVEIRPESPADARCIRDVLIAAFETDAEATLVDQLRCDGAYIGALSLVAVRDDAVIGHILLTQGSIESDAAPPVPALALAPMAVLPDCQRNGIGTALVHRALTNAAAFGHELVIVLGHPDYYPRFGFVPASTYGIMSPFDVPDEVFMALWLGDAKPRSINGVMQYAEPFTQLS